MAHQVLIYFKADDEANAILISDACTPEEVDNVVAKMNKFQAIQELLMDYAAHCVAFKSFMCYGGDKDDLVSLRLKVVEAARKVEATMSKWKTTSADLAVGRFP